MAVDAVRKATGATFHLHEDDLPVLHSAPELVSLWLSAHIDPIADPDAFLTHGQVIRFGKESLEVRFTPGHAPGHVVFVDYKGEQVFAGDTLFQGSIGRFDLPGADGEILLQSIREQLLTLPDPFAVYPGHGPSTTIGHEREYNPFVGRSAVLL
jgi:glyoxylase-like metal-dependent hydrolase (beta-lactamase superfamily II)